MLIFRNIFIKLSYDYKIYHRAYRKLQPKPGHNQVTLQRLFQFWDLPDVNSKLAQIALQRSELDSQITVQYILLH